jgi:AraC-like DNA-binding protein
VSLTDFLNELRVEDAKRRLLDPGHDCFSIEGIAAQSGFGSRSAFYAALRRLGETAPSELRRRSELMAPERSPSRYRRPDRPA